MHDVDVTSGLIYRTHGGTQLLADLYVPKTTEPPHVALYIHGGGFQFGSRTDDGENRIKAVARHGIALLSVDYRLAPEARHPDQLDDLRAAVRWLREQSAAFGIDATRIGAFGASAGGLLASLLGLVPGPAEEAVQAVVAWFPMTDVLISAARSWLEAEIYPFQFEAALLGVSSVDQITTDPELRARAEQASPVNWARADAPPFLVAHGDRDRITPDSQSRLLHDALVRAGAESTLVTLGAAGHEDRRFESPAHLALTAAWLRETLTGAS